METGGRCGPGIFVAGRSGTGAASLQLAVREIFCAEIYAYFYGDVPRSTIRCSACADEGLHAACEACVDSAAPPTRAEISARKFLLILTNTRLVGHRHKTDKTREPGSCMPRRPLDQSAGAAQGRDNFLRRNFPLSLLNRASVAPARHAGARGNRSGLPPPAGCLHDALDVFAPYRVRRPAAKPDKFLRGTSIERPSDNH